MPFLIGNVVYSLSHYIYEINLKTHSFLLFKKFCSPWKMCETIPTTVYSSLLYLFLAFLLFSLHKVYLLFYVRSLDSVLRLEYNDQILWYRIKQREALQPLLCTQCKAQICFLRQCKQPWEKENGFMGIEKSFYSWLSLTRVAGRKTRIEMDLQKKVLHLRNWVMEHIFSDEFVLCFTQCNTSKDVYFNNTNMLHFTGAQGTEFKRN